MDGVYKHDGSKTPAKSTKECLTFLKICFAKSIHFLYTAKARLPDPATIDIHHTGNSLPLTTLILSPVAKDAQGTPAARTPYHNIYRDTGFHRNKSMKMK